MIDSIALVALDEVLSTLDAEQDRIADAAGDAIFAELDGYRGVPRQAVRASMRTNVARAVATLRSGRAPAPSTKGEAAAVAAARARQGVPIDDVIRAYRISLRIIHSRFMELAEHARVDSSTALRCSNLLWQVGDWFTAIAAGEFRDLQAEQAVHRSVRRKEALRNLLTGLIAEADLWRVASTLEIDANQRFCVFCFRAVDGPTQDFSPALGGTVTMSGWNYGIVPETRAGSLPEGRSVALGPARSLSKIPESTHVARQVADLLDTDRPGIYRVDDLPWSVAAHAVPEVLTYLRRKYLEPLSTIGDFGETLLDTVAEYLAADLNVPLTASKLIVHPNTLRYRLARYQSLVGVRLQATRSIVELTMLLGLSLSAEADSESLSRTPTT